MALTKNTLVDKIEIIALNNGQHYGVQVRERKQILEDGQEISSSFHRYSLNPDHDVSTISDPVVKAQFEAVMTQEVKDNYATFLASQNKEVSESE